MKRFCLADRVFAVMEDAGGKHRIGVTFNNAVGQMRKRAHAAGCNDRNGNGVRYRARQRKVKAAFRAVAIHAGQQDFAGAQNSAILARPLDHVESRVLAATVRENLPARGFARGADTLCVNGDHDALRTMFVRRGRARVADSPPPMKFMLILSAPAFSNRRTSSTARTPPPTVSGINTCDATRSMIGRIRSRWSEVAVISRNVSSSAPWSSYRRAIFDRIAGVAQFEEIDAL